MSNPLQEFSPRTTSPNLARAGEGRFVSLARVALVSLAAAMVCVGVYRLVWNTGGDPLIAALEIIGWLTVGLLMVVVYSSSRRLRAAAARSSESEMRFRLMADASPMMVWSVTAEGVGEYCNRAWAVFMGDQIKATLTETWRAAIHPDDYPACHEAFQLAHQNRRDFRWEFRLRRHDGEYRWLLSCGSPRFGPDGAYAGMIGLCVDVTEQRIDEQRLREAVLKYETLVRLAPMGIFQTEANGDCLFVNDRWCAMAGMSDAEARGRGWLGAIHPDDRERVQQAWYRAASERVEYNLNSRYLRPDGTVVWGMANALALRDAEGRITGHLGTVADVTALKEAEVQLRGALGEQVATAHRENLLRRELDHRVRNNLAGLLGLIRVCTEAPGSSGMVAERLRATVRTMANVHDLMSRTPGESVALDELLGMLLRAVGSERAARVSISGARLLVPALRVNAMAMILQELITNSVKHGALASVAGKVEMRWTTRTDNAEALDMVWRETGAGSVRDSGAGAGLALIRSLAASDLHGSCETEFGSDGLVCTLSVRLGAAEGSPMEEAIA